MIQINFDHKEEQDDKPLIQLLKEETKEFPSEQLVESTLARIAAMQSEKNWIHRPLRIPLYIMAAMGVFLFAPLFVSMISNTSSLIPWPAFLDHPDSYIINYVVGCWLLAVLLKIAKLLVQSQFKLA